MDPARGALVPRRQRLLDRSGVHGSRTRQPGTRSADSKELVVGEDHFGLEPPPLVLQPGVQPLLWDLRKRLRDTDADRADADFKAGRIALCPGGLHWVANVSLATDLDHFGLESFAVPPSA